ncbi:MAG: cadmium-translocating P-type ATPase [Planctomycetales bacterium]|nr:cadmium-translocating P-type ATPase [Planctomycetales bacterium]
MDATRAPAAAAEPAARRIFRVTGMRCAACAGTIERAVSSLPGVRAAAVNLAAEKLAVEWEAGAVPDEAGVSRRVADAGYGAQPAAAGAGRVIEAEGEGRALALVAALALPLAGLAWSGLADSGAGGLVAIALAGALQVLGGAPFYRGALGALRNRTATMDTLVALGTTVAAAYGALAVAVPSLAPHGAGHFFEASALLLLFVRVGKALEARARRRAGEALRALLALRPPAARVERGGELVTVLAEEVRAGDVIRVLAGDAFPADGVVLEGRAAADEAMLTGESVPVEKGPGDRVLGGTVSRSGTVRVRATGVGEETAVARLTRMVEDAQAGKAPIQRLADRVSRWFVPAVVLAAALTGAGWFALGGASADEALSRAVAVLVIACPCALGLAVPVAVLVGSGAGLRRGILVKHAAALEVAGRVRTLAFDKTGTLTRGAPAVAEVRTPPGVGEADAWAAAAPVAAASAHPLARALFEAARARGVGGEALGAAEVPGRGVRGTVSGAEVVLGNAAFLAAEAPNATALGPLADEMARRGVTPVLCARDGRAVAVFGLADPIKPEAGVALARLARMGVRTVLLSGDREPVAAAVARQAGIADVRAPLRPEEKVAAVRALCETAGPAGMVGDGVNDAPALAEADLGIAIGGGTDVAKETGDLVLVRDDLRDVVRAVELGRATLRTIRQNLGFSLAYNLAMVPLAAGLVPGAPAMHPGLAGLAMALSSISVVLNSARLGRVRLDA